MILLIDNYDSFTYNLLHYMGELNADVEVVRNDAITIDDIAKRSDIGGIVLSPGPCDPDKAGICLDVVKNFTGKMPILGVCLGHQTIGQAFGGSIIRAEKPMHGKVNTISCVTDGIFKNVPQAFDVTRYHSLIIERETLPSCFKITAETEDGVIMGIEHLEYPIFGVQFHPESIASQYGHAILQNFLNYCND